MVVVLNSGEFIFSTSGELMDNGELFQKTSLHINELEKLLLLLPDKF